MAREPSPPDARGGPDRRVLIVSLSGRALAESASAAGWLPIVIDSFGDVDTAKAALACARVRSTADSPFEVEALLAEARRLAPPPIPVAWGSGFDGRPDLLAPLAAGRELLGNDPATVQRAKDPATLATLCADLGVPHPAVRFDLPEEREEWLVKRVGGAGGSHVRPAAEVQALRPDRYVQRRVPGRPVAALLLGDGRNVATLGFSEQWPAPDRERRLFRFAGVAAPAMLEPGVEVTMRAAAESVAERLGLRGLASADFLLAEDGSFHLLEINPRPGASLEAWERALGRSLFDLHVRACRGELPTVPPVARTTAATRIVWAPYDVRVPQALRWPAWSADRTPGRRVVFRGNPLCTVRAEAADAASARAAVERLAEDILARMIVMPHQWNPPARDDED